MGILKTVLGRVFRFNILSSQSIDSPQELIKSEERVSVHTDVDPSPQSSKVKNEVEIERSKSPLLQEQPSPLESSAVELKGDDLVRFMQNLKKIFQRHQSSLSAGIAERKKEYKTRSLRGDFAKVESELMDELKRHKDSLRNLEGFEHLLFLQSKYQDVQNNLLPLEEEISKLRERWETEIYHLKVAELTFYDEYKFIFREAQRYPSRPQTPVFRFAPSQSQDELTDSWSEESEEPRIYVSYPSHESLASDMTFETPFRQFNSQVHDQSELLNFTGGDESLGNESHLTSLDSPNLNSEDSSKIRLAQLSKGQIALSFSEKQLGEQRVNLPANPFSTNNRTNDWLFQKLLWSRFEVQIYKSLVDAENSQTPSDWSKLAVALWNFDEAAVRPPESEVDGDSTESHSE